MVREGQDEPQQTQDEAGQGEEAQAGVGGPRPVDQPDQAGGGERAEVLGVRCGPAAAPTP
ncbi:hypothetical protein ACFCVY_02510 [Streptomyces sp. NPDC056411]|uniref:hypothetical protein n=1 Tax=Streptomyces sp. NPDC056411 TaxID=3345813 RepID=UPI0035E252D0